ncbi:MAG: TRAP transporter small permease [Paracoccaceae bacterium]|nr:TRAP transporter small permease [Paracoccaceae bacterium]
MHRAFYQLARTMAALGGLVLGGLILLTSVSVLGRGLNTLGHSGLPEGLGATLQGFGPITGDFELVEAGIAFAVFAFLPWCQMRGGHASVDLFTAALPGWANRCLIAFWEVVFALVTILIAWRISAGMLGKISNGETTYLLQVPVWWAYAASSFAAGIAAVVAVYAASQRVVGALGRWDRLPGGAPPDNKGHGH